MKKYNLFKPMITGCKAISWVTCGYMPINKNPSHYDGSESFPTMIIWNSWASTKVSCFVWELMWKEILTLDILKRRGWTLVNKCFLCKGKEEFCDHILLHFSKANMLWQLVFSLSWVVWVLHTCVHATLLGWHNYSIGKKRRKAWNVAPLCLFWTICKERNKRAFENVELLDQELKFTFPCNFLEWFKGGLRQESFSVID